MSAGTVVRGILPVILLAGAIAPSLPARADDPPYRRIEVRSLADNRAYPGKLYLPPDVARAPIVVMLPGTDGVDERQDFHRGALLAAGIGTFELDTKTGVFTSEADRPDADAFVPVAYGALRVLARMADVDSGRVALLGWSAGGTVTLRAAHQSASRQWAAPGGPRFVAYIGLYGGCHRTRELADVPVLILVGDNDGYGAYRSCPEFARTHHSVRLTVYPGVRHGFDKPLVNKGRGSRIMEWNEDAAVDARRRVVDFLTEVFRR